jgi:hypothetical protein
MRKETCWICNGRAIGCERCNGYGYILISDAPHKDLKGRFNNKPHGTPARDGSNYGIGVSI